MEKQTKEQREEIKRDSDTLALISKREFLLRRVLNRRFASTAERDELKAILAQRAAIYAKHDIRRID